MSAKLVGIGIVSMGCLAAAAVGGYLAMKPGLPMPTEVQAEPAAVSRTTPEAVTPPDSARPTAAPARNAPAKAAAPAARTLVTGDGKPITTAAPVRAPEPESPQPAPTPTISPVATAPPPVPAPVPDPPVATPTPVAAEPPRYVPDSPVTPATAQEPSRIEFEELTVAKHSVIGIRLDTAISTRTARVEDRVTATVSRDVTVSGRTAIAAGARLEGTVVLVERGGRFKNRARLGLEFDRMILADGTRVNIKTDTIYREGDAPEADATAKVGTGAVAGAILGAVIGGKKGAAIGTAAGAVGGAAAVMRGDPGESSLPGGAPLTVRLTEDLIITINR